MELPQWPVLTHAPRAHLGRRRRWRLRFPAGPTIWWRCASPSLRATGAGPRFRLLATGNVNRTTPTNARSVGTAALRSTGPRLVDAEGPAALRLLSKRGRDLGILRTQSHH
jgi:hypothetical protein